MRRKLHAPVDVRQFIFVAMVAVIATFSVGMTRAIIGYPLAFALGYGVGRWTRKRANP